MPQYVAVAANTSGSTPKDLFEDVAEELEKQVVQVFYIFEAFGFCSCRRGNCLF